MNPDAFSSPQVQEAINKYLPFLLEARKRLLFLACLFLIASGVGFIFYEKIIFLLLDFLRLDGVNIVFTSPFQFFSLAVNSALFVGIVAIFPFVIYQTLSFLKPALKPREFRMVLLPLPLSILLMLIGFVYGINIMKYVVSIFYQKSVELQIGNILDIELLISKIMLTSALMAIAFQFPIVISVLLHLKVITMKLITSQRQIAYGLMLIFVMFLPPTDMLSNVLLVLPLVFLFELTLVCNKLLLRA